MQKLSTQPYKGTRDFLPEEMSVRTQIFETMFRAIERYGFRRYDGPILESAAIYEAKSGEEIANQQLYRLVDKGDRELALRPEMTPSVARIVAGNADQIVFPARWYSHVNCHRYERPQRGRVREHWQINVDIFGSEEVEAEVEIFDLVADLMSAMGATPEMWIFRVNDRILVEAALRNFVGVPQEKLAGVGMAIDRWEKVDADTRKQTLTELGMSGDQIQRLEELVQMDLKAYGKAAGEEAVSRSKLAKIVSENLSQAPLKFDPLVMRAFNYYTSTVFEVFDASPENRRSIFGGGRYDDLASLFTTRKIPGVGFAVGDVTTWNFMEQHHLLPKPDLGPDVFVFGTSPDYRGPVRDLTRALRRAGFRAEPALDSPNIRNGLKHANRLGVKHVVMVADEEFKSNSAVVKDMVGSTQQTLPYDAVVSFLTKS
ncbi:MAG TPA: histidine--tRNA ligase [Bryobacteraceae bacterium]|jgi:histidyl-tRNA synthetase|nr:histidine--tRNA ligase [Bryobacteraceae bacterium]